MQFILMTHNTPLPYRCLLFYVMYALMYVNKNVYVKQICLTMYFPIFKNMKMKLVWFSRSPLKSVELSLRSVMLSSITEKDISEMPDP